MGAWREILVHARDVHTRPTRSCSPRSTREVRRRLHAGTTPRSPGRSPPCVYLPRAQPPLCMSPSDVTCARETMVQRADGTSRGWKHAHPTSPPTVTQFCDQGAFCVESGVSRGWPSSAWSRQRRAIGRGCTPLSNAEARTQRPSARCQPSQDAERRIVIGLSPPGLPYRILLVKFAL
jgi:hypothetical protein